MPIPALSKAYHTRANVPFGANNTSAALISKFSIWALKAAMMDQHSAGSTSGTRHANATWTCVGSSDGATAGLDASDRWGSTFDVSKIVRANSGTAHSWIVLRNSTLGYDVCIDVISSSDNEVSITATKSSVPFTGGSTTTRPQTSSNTEEFTCGNAASGIVSASLLPDLTTGGTNYFHYTTDDSGSFHFTLSRATVGYFPTCIAFLPGVGGRTADTRNMWFVGVGQASGRGAPHIGGCTNNQGMTRRPPNNSTLSVQGPQGPNFGSQAYFGSKGVDAITGDYLSLPVIVMVISTGSGDFPVYCGKLPDWHHIGAAGIGGGYPLEAARTHCVVGDFLIPWNTVIPVL